MYAPRQGLVFRLSDLREEALEGTSFRDPNATFTQSTWNSVSRVAHSIPSSLALHGVRLDSSKGSESIRHRESVWVRPMNIQFRAAIDKNLAKVCRSP
jgi:hypothetical protein